MRCRTISSDIRKRIISRSFVKVADFKMIRECVRGVRCIRDSEEANLSRIFAVESSYLDDDYSSTRPRLCYHLFKHFFTLLQFSRAPAAT